MGSGDRAPLGSEDRTTGDRRGSSSRVWLGSRGGLHRCGADATVSGQGHRSQQPHPVLTRFGGGVDPSPREGGGGCGGAAHRIVTSAECRLPDQLSIGCWPRRCLVMWWLHSVEAAPLVGDHCG